MTWTKDIYRWIANRKLYMSIPFTWLLPKAQMIIDQIDFEYDSVIAGGPAVKLMPDYLTGAIIQGSCNGILQRINPHATRTTEGCPNKCKFCGIGCGKIEPGGLIELDDWHDAPIICDNNLLAASDKHFDKVIDRLIIHGWADFNQGLDCRLLTEHHAKRIREIPNPQIRLALDNIKESDQWQKAFDILRDAGIRKKEISSYFLVGFNTDVKECWERGRWLERHWINTLPMWYHSLDCLEWNGISEEQFDLGWSDKEMKKLMGYFYQRRGKYPYEIVVDKS